MLRVCQDMALHSLILIPPAVSPAPSPRWGWVAKTVGSEFGCLFLLGLPAQDFTFPQPTLLRYFKGERSRLLLLPFLALSPYHHHIHPAQPSPHSDPAAKFQRPLCSVSQGMEFPGHFSSSLALSCQVPHTLSLRPALARSLEREQKRPCSLHCPFPSLFSPLPSHPPLLSTQLCSEGVLGESPCSVQSVWWCWGFPLILHCFLHSPACNPCQPPPPPLRQTL